MIGPKHSGARSRPAPAGLRRGRQRRRKHAHVQPGPARSRAALRRRRAAHLGEVLLVDSPRAGRRDAAGALGIRTRDAGRRSRGRSALGRQAGAGVAASRCAGWPRCAVFRNVKTSLGLQRARTLISAAAPISAELLRWYVVIGLEIVEGYGQTESGAIVTLYAPHERRLGTVGKPMFGNEIRISGEGEILIRGPGVFMGYLNQPEKTGADHRRRGLAAFGRRRPHRRGWLRRHHRPDEGHHHHRRRQERHAFGDRESAQVQPVHRRRDRDRRPAQVPDRADHDRPRERGEVRAGPQRAVHEFRQPDPGRRGDRPDRPRGQRR